MSKLYEYSFSIADIVISAHQVMRGMGYVNRKAPEYLVPLVNEFLGESKKYLSIKAGFLLVDEHITIDSKKIIIDDVELNPHKIINRHLKGATRLAIFTATAGIEFDKWIRSFYDSNEQLNGYIVDTIGSEVVESTGDKLEAILKEVVNPDNCSNRLSPGYCNWSVADQHKLFSLLPEDFCGIRLTDSALMNPIKSISGVIGIGSEVKRLDYQCNICDLENCYKRIREVRISGD